MTAYVPGETALMMVDMQNDFLHPEGAYARGGATSELIAALPARLKPVADAARAAGAWIVSTHFTLVPGKDGAPFIDAHLKSLRPFLGKGDFAPGSFGHALIDELAPADLSVEKVAYSAFYMSRLEWMANRAGIKRLVFVGIVTNGGGASTVRDSHVRGYEIEVLSDGCAAFDADVHQVSIEALRSVAGIITYDDAIKGFSP
jgi:nicotinamidase-related amidase